MKTEWIRASAGLGFILATVFFPTLFGNKTLLTSVWNAASVMNSGAYGPPGPRSSVSRTSDPGAPAWTTEPWFKLISDQYWHEHNAPLWNPYNAYGTPLAASMQSQPFYPLAALLSLHPTPRTYNIFIIARLFAAGLLMFLFARLFLSGLPSLFAAVTFMLTGYFIVLLNMPHVSVEVLLPGLLLTLELVLRKNSWGSVAAAAGMIFLCAVGGMPESLFLILAFGCIYFVWRLLFTPEFRDQAFPLFLKLLASIVFGFALSAFLLLPFVELLKTAHDVHQPSNVGGDKTGLARDTDYRAIILYLLPLVFGPVGNSIFSNFSGWTGAWSYWGVIPCFFAGSAVLFWFFPRKVAHPQPLRALTGFFAIMLALMILKRFGHPIIQWVGDLPIADMVNYMKYQEPLTALCVAMLAGIGFSLLAGNRAKSSYFLVTAVAFLGVMLALVGWSLPRVVASPQFGVFFYLSVLGGVLFVLAAVMMIAWFSASNSPELRVWIIRGLVGLLCLELSVNFILPCFYLLNSLPPAKKDPYAGAPYIDFVRARNTDHSRVFAREGFLFPNWSAAFKLEDVRDLDAIYFNRYRTFIRNFLLKPGDEQRRHGDLADRFTGAELPYRFDTDIEKRFLALSSIRYLISSSEYGVSSTVLDEIVDQHKGETIWGFGPGSFLIGDGKSPPVRGLSQHPPSARISYRTVINPSQPIFQGTAIMRAEALDKTDGAGFLVEIKSDGNVERLFYAVLNPKQVAEDRDGRAFRIDLSRYAGKDVELLLSTDPGPSGNNEWDWAVWTKLAFAPKDEAAGALAFREVYDKEVRVYEFGRPLPRASLFRSVEVLPDSEVLARLKDPAFDPSGKAVLSRESLADVDPAIVRSLTGTPAGPPSAASILRYESQHVWIDAETDAPAVLMLNDANYPGWRAYVNGNPAPMVTSDYLFRGVVLPAGRNRVEFVYQPNSFRLGVLVSLAALAALLSLVFLERRRRRTTALRMQT